MPAADGTSIDGNGGKDDSLPIPDRELDDDGDCDGAGGRGAGSEDGRKGVEGGVCELRKKQLEQFERLQGILGEGNAPHNAANHILDVLLGR